MADPGVAVAALFSDGRAPKHSSVMSVLKGQPGEVRYAAAYRYLERTYAGASAVVGDVLTSLGVGAAGATVDEMHTILLTALGNPLTRDSFCTKLCEAFTAVDCKRDAASAAGQLVAVTTTRLGSQEQAFIELGDAIGVQNLTLKVLEKQILDAAIERGKTVLLEPWSASISAVTLSLLNRTAAPAPAASPPRLGGGGGGAGAAAASPERSGATQNVSSGAGEDKLARAMRGYAATCHLKFSDMGLLAVQISPAMHEHRSNVTRLLSQWGDSVATVNEHTAAALETGPCDAATSLYQPFSATKAAQATFINARQPWVGSRTMDRADVMIDEHYAWLLSRVLHSWDAAPGALATKFSVVTTPLAWESAVLDITGVIRTYEVAAARALGDHAGSGDGYQTLGARYTLVRMGRTALELSIGGSCGGSNPFATALLAVVSFASQGYYLFKPSPELRQQLSDDLWAFPATPAERPAVLSGLYPLPKSSEAAGAGSKRPAVRREGGLREHRGKECKKRMVFGGHLLKPYIHKASFAYSGIPSILEHHETGDEYGKADASNFFYCGAYSPRSRPYLCCSFPGLGGTGVAQFERWIMGAPDSPLCASLLSSLVVFIARLRAGDDRLVAYMDDFLWAVPAGGDPARLRDALVHTLRVGNIPENVRKRVEAGKSTELLGLVFRSDADMLELPARKQFKYMVHAFTVVMLLRDARMRGAVSKDSLLSLAGRLQWWCCAAAYGRPHLGGLYAAAKMPARSAAMAARVLENLTWWETRWLSGTLTGQILINPRKRTFIRVCGGAADRKLRVFEADAGEPGGGAVCDGKAVYVPFGPNERTKSSQWREARVILELFEVAGPSLEGACVLVLTDNLGNVFNFMKGSCKAREVTKMIQTIYDIGERHGITWVVSWLPRECNQTADAISKCATRAEAAALCGLTLEEPATATAGGE